MSAKYRSGFEYFTEVFSKEYKVDKSILAGAAREVWENELTDEDRASWEEMARLSEQEESAAKAEQQKKPEDKKAEEEKKAAEAKKKAEEEKKAAEAKKAEEERKAAEAKKAEEEKKAAEAKKAEEERKAEEARKAEEEKKAAEAKKAEEERKAAEAKKKAEEERKAEEARKAEEEKKAEEAKKKAEEEKKAAEAKKAEEERKAAEAKKAEEERKAAEARKKAEEERKAEEARKAEEEKKAADAKKKAEEEKKAAEQELSASKSPISGAEADMLGSPDSSQKIALGAPLGVTEGKGMEAEKPKEPAPDKPPAAPAQQAGAPGMDLDRLKQAIGKRVSPQEEEAAPKGSAGPEHDQQFGGFRDTLSSSGFFTSSGPIKSGLTISANRPRQVAKEAPVDRTSGGYSPESIPEIQDPSAVSLDAPSAAVMRVKLMEKAEELADAVISRALDGDVQALTLCIERVLAPAEEYRLHIDLPPLDSQEHILQASEAVVRAVSLGELDPQQAKTLHELIEAHWRILEGSELSSRVSQLEQRGTASKRQKITLGAFDKPF